MWSADGEARHPQQACIRYEAFGRNRCSPCAQVPPDAAPRPRSFDQDRTGAAGCDLDRPPEARRFPFLASYAWRCFVLVRPDAEMGHDPVPRGG
ncbi:MAG TPA: hypothetical protein DEW46_10720 [Verrucomicrobia bacterium]|nr:hypothetical protein [Verrucomicrobiota bacterium]